MSKGMGALPAQMIKRMVGNGMVSGLEENICPSSLDLRVTSEIHRVEGIFLPRPGESVRDVLRVIETSKHDFSSPLEPSGTYIAKLEESLGLPPDVYGYCNPKSSSGRINLQVKVMADGVSRYDAAAPGGFAGDLWLVMVPGSFPVRLSAGELLSQIRFFNSDTRFTNLELKFSMIEDKLLWDKSGETSFLIEDLQGSDNDGSLILTIDLESEIAGWECLGEKKVLDFSRRDYEPLDFFRPLTVRNGRINLKKGGFYIFSTKERVRVPPYLACEMVAMDERSGNFRSHFAGFIDPGWGWGKEGEGHGRPLVLEIIPYEDLMVRDGQPIAKVRFEHLITQPDIGYDDRTASSYNREFSTPRLSKHFKQ